MTRTPSDGEIYYKTQFTNDEEQAAFEADMDAYWAKAMQQKCSYSDEYKAIYPPTCGCNPCADKWANRHKKDT